MTEQQDQYEDVNLEIISCLKLLEGDVQTIAALYAAAVQDGFFYLDFTGQSTFDIPQHVSALYETAASLFHLPLKERLKYDTVQLGNSENNCYKPLDPSIGFDKGNGDGREIFLLPRDIVLWSSLKETLLALPEVLLDDLPLIQDFEAECQQICTVVLICLSRSLGLNSLVGLEQCHRPDRPSTSALALLKYKQQESKTRLAGHVAHTDVSTLTLSFSRQPGLQIFDFNTNGWANVRPMPNCAVVNVGDSLRVLSGYVFRSSLYRVLPGTSNETDARFSVIYFMRPERNEVMQDGNGDKFTSLELHSVKFEALTSPNESTVRKILRGNI